MKRCFRQIIQYDSLLGHKYVPNLTACLQYGKGNYIIETDELGFRNAGEKKAGKLKIVVIGDSYAAGDGVSNPERFNDLIVDKFDCEITNLAVSGYGVDQQLLAYEQYAKNIDHDLVIFMPHLDDLTRNLLSARIAYDKGSGEQVHVPKPYFLAERDQLILKNVPVPRQRDLVKATPLNGDAVPAKSKTRYHYYKDWVKSIYYSRISRRSSYPQYHDHRSQEWAMMSLLMDKLKKLTGDRKLLIFPLPFNEAIIYKEPLKYISIFRQFEDERTKVFDLAPKLSRAYHNLKSPVFLEICGHFSAAGHRVVADEISAELAARYGLRNREKAFGTVKKHSSVVLGISCFYHDSAAALIIDGKIIAAAQEERFTRIKHDKAFPINAINYCIEEGKIRVGDIDAFVYYDYETWTIERVMANAKFIGDKGEAFWEMAGKSLYQKLRLPKVIRETTGYKGKIYKTQHHISHAASAYYPSGFDNAAILIIDGVGEWACTTIATGKNGKIEILKQQFYPHSLGLLYSALTYYTGFKVNSGEYKLMGLAPYGKPIYADQIKKELITMREDGSILLNLDYFSFQEGVQMTNEKFDELFGGPPRQPESRITFKEMNLAASIQQVTEEIVTKMANHAYQLTGSTNLVMAGGVALNCVANGVLYDATPFREIFFQPASGDAGGALGCALSWYYENNKASHYFPVMEDAYLGPAFSGDEILAFLETKDIPAHRFAEGERSAAIAELLYDDKVIGYFDGRMEFGPRALGARSIIANALNPEMQSKLNLKIKYRESFRPFAPIYLEERTADFFEFNKPSPFMLVVRNVKKELLNDDVTPFEQGDEDLISVINQVRSALPAITHVDNSARLQSVNEKQNARFYSVLRDFEKLSGKGILINTSFNVRGEPIVCTPHDAYRCFMRTEMDVLILGDYYLLKSEQPKFTETENWREIFQLD